MSATAVKTPTDTPPPVVQRDSLPPQAQGVAGEPQYDWLRKLLTWLFPVAALLFGTLVVIPGLLQKWLWMRELNYVGIFWTLLSVKCGMTCAAFIGASLFLWINLRHAARSSFAPAESDPATQVGSLEKTLLVTISGITISHGAAKRP